jgi:hypothetical protein
MASLHELLKHIFIEIQDLSSNFQLLIYLPVPIILELAGLDAAISVKRRLCGELQNPEELEPEW